MNRQTDSQATSAHDDQTQGKAEETASQDTSNQTPEGPQSLEDIVSSTLGPSEEEQGAGDTSGEQAANPGDDVDSRDGRDGLNADPASQEGQEGQGGPEGDNEDADDAELWKGASDEELQQQLADKRTKGGLRKNLKRILKLREKARELSGELDEVRPVVETTRPIYDAMQKHGLSQENMNELIQVGAVLRQGDFQKFAEMVRPYLDQAEQATGQRLPQDLQQQVDAGYVTQEVASELAQRRYQNDLAQRQLSAAEQQRQQDEARNSQEQKVGTVRETLNAWEQNTLASDPDYAQVRQAVHEQVQLEVKANGVPETKEQANEMANRAYKRVRDLARPAAPKRSTAPRPASGHANSGTTPAKEPKSVEDVVNSVLGG